MCGQHQRQQREQIKWHEPDRQRIGQHAEQRRHQAGAEVGAGHLHTDDGLGSVRAESARQAVAEQAGDDGSRRDNHGHRAGPGNRHAKL